jgi:hypothetical protein
LLILSKIFLSRINWNIWHSYWIFLTWIKEWIKCIESCVPDYRSFLTKPARHQIHVFILWPSMMCRILNMTNLLCMKLKHFYFVFTKGQCSTYKYFLTFNVCKVYIYSLCFYIIVYDTYIAFVVVKMLLVSTVIL